MSHFERTASSLGIDGSVPLAAGVVAQGEMSPYPVSNGGDDPSDGGGGDSLPATAQADGGLPPPLARPKPREQGRRGGVFQRPLPSVAPPS